MPPPVTFTDMFAETTLLTKPPPEQVTVCVMVALPGVTPVTLPFTTVATVGLDVLQFPDVLTAILARLIVGATVPTLACASDIVSGDSVTEAQALAVATTVTGMVRVTVLTPKFPDCGEVMATLMIALPTLTPVMVNVARPLVVVVGPDDTVATEGCVLV